GGYDVIADVGEHPFQLHKVGQTTLQANVTKVFDVDGQKIPTGTLKDLPKEMDFNTAKPFGPNLDNSFTIKADANGVVKAVLHNKETSLISTFEATGMFSAKPGEEAVIHFWSGSTDPKSPYYGVGAIENVTTTANGPNRQGQIGGSRLLGKDDERKGSITMTVQSERRAAMAAAGRKQRDRTGKVKTTPSAPPNQAMTVNFELPTSAIDIITNTSNMRLLRKMNTVGSGDLARSSAIQSILLALALLPQAGLRAETPDVNQAWNLAPAIATEKGAAVEPPGGIDLNAKNMQMNVSGQKIDIRFNPALVEQFRRGDFSGVTPIIVNVTPIINPMPLLGLSPAKEENLTAGV
ncbi:MAG: hypothetical protein WCH62_07750, partial [Candidatus Omnitrophota bacterium]